MDRHNQAGKSEGEVDVAEDMFHHKVCAQGNISVLQLDMLDHPIVCRGNQKSVTYVHDTVHNYQKVALSLKDSAI